MLDAFCCAKISSFKIKINRALPKRNYLWDETVRKYATKIEQVKRVMADDILADNILPDLCADMEHFLSLCANPEFQIALVGTIKAGKSTLINALLN